MLSQGLSVFCAWLWVDSLSQLWEISSITYFLCSPFWNSLSFPILEFLNNSLNFVLSIYPILSLCVLSLYLSIHLFLSLSLVVFSWKFHQLCLPGRLLDKIQDTQGNVDFGQTKYCWGHIYTKHYLSFI